MIKDNRITYINKVTNKIYDDTASLYEEMMDNETGLALIVLDELERSIDAIRANVIKNGNKKTIKTII
jgi:spermidine/putrescine-binding protein|tara:strand:+ start:996 stop:1199 length:204 start_codon:yes stop_codon:yes gene_type:complete